eukprot:gene30627-39900_t
MSLLSNFLWFLTIYIPIFWAIKLAYILSPQNPIAELKCWTLQFLDSQCIPYDNYYFRPLLKECTANLKSQFPQGSSWDLPDNLKVVELTPSTMKEYFSSHKNALNTPFIIRGFLNQPDTDFDLNKYADIHYLLENVQSNSTYVFDTTGKAPKTLTLKSALEGMLARDGLYMKFNRELTKNEEVFGTAIDRATDVTMWALPRRHHRLGALPPRPVLLDTSIKFFKLKMNGLLASSSPVAGSFLDADAQRGQSW